MRFFHSSVIGGGTSSPPTGGGGGSWPQYYNDYFVAYVEPTPTGSGVRRDVSNIIEWNAAVTAANPGDVIRITTTITGQNFASSCLEYRGSNAGSLTSGPGSDGTSANPITITCSPGAWIDLNNTTAYGASGLDIIRCEHVDVVGVNIRNSAYGLRYITSGGSSARQARIMHNEIHTVAGALLYVGALSSTDGTDSRYVDVAYNDLYDTTGSIPFSEGIYIGTGSDSYSWQDNTHHINIYSNHIQNTRGDGIDIKPGVYDIFVFHNLVHDCGAQVGSGIGAAQGSHPNPPAISDPNPSTLKRIEIYENWIYNIGYAFGGVSSSSYGINANLAGMQVYRNTVWSMDPANTGNVRGINCAIYDDVSAHQSNVYENTVWVSGGGAITYGLLHASSAANYTFSNNITGDGTQGSTIASVSDFVGPVPAINPSAPSASADVGLGPGSAFVLAASSSIPASTGSLGKL